MRCLSEGERYVQQNSFPAINADMIPAIDVEGIFRLAGAERRIKELMAMFNAPERYGRGLDWTGYTVHDAANLLRRYLNQLPEPIIPLAMYPRFRDPLRNHQAQAVGPIDQQGETHGDFDADETIRIFQQLITELPSLNRQLLLYILDLLAVFASKCEVNRMTAPNLSAIFQPGILRHPDHDMVPSEYRLSQDVVIFLIEHQDNFVIGLPGTAADEKTIQDIQSGPKPGTAPTTPKGRTQQLLGRSASSASAGSDSARRYGGLRRNASVNSRGSRQSQNTPSPQTPPAGSPFLPGSKGSGVHRSNTLPSKKSPSPALSGSERFSRFHAAEPLPVVAAATIPTAHSPLTGVNENPAAATSTERLGQHDRSPPNFQAASSPQRSPFLRPWVAATGRSSSHDRQLSAVEGLHEENRGRASPSGTPSRERGLSSMFKSSPASASDSERKGDHRRKLQKKRPPGEISAQASQQSLGGTISNPVSPAFTSTIGGDHTTGQHETFRTDLPERPMISTVNSFQTAHEHPSPSPQTTTAATIVRDSSTTTLKPNQMALKDLPQRHSGATVRGKEHSPSGSITSHSTGADGSSLSTGEDGDGLEMDNTAKKQSRWRMSMKSKKDGDGNSGEVLNFAPSAAEAERSESSVGSSSRLPRQSYTDESNPSTSVRAPSSSEAEDRATSPRRGPIGWFRGKMQERKAEKERAKSPTPRGGMSDQSASTQSLGAIASAEIPTPAHSQQQAPPIPPVPAVYATAPPAELEDLSQTAANPPGPAVTPPAQISTSDLTSADAPIADTNEAITPKAPQQPLRTVDEPVTSISANVESQAANQETR